MFSDYAFLVQDGLRRFQGTVVEWNTEKGFGFIRPRGVAEEGEVIFLPARALQNRRRPPVVGDTVTYGTEASRSDGRRLRASLRAVDVAFTDEMRQDESSVSSMNRGWVLAAIYILVVMGVYPALGVGFATLSIVSFLSYAADKRRAKRREFRIPEGQLLLVDLLGGWPGGLLGQISFRHKTQKASFQTLFWIVVALNVLVGLGVAAYLRTNGAPLNALRLLK